jgi:hypothetical protein
MFKFDSITGKVYEDGKEILGIDVVEVRFVLAGEPHKDRVLKIYRRKTDENGVLILEFGAPIEQIIQLRDFVMVGEGNDAIRVDSITGKVYENDKEISGLDEVEIRYVRDLSTVNGGRMLKIRRHLTDSDGDYATEFSAPLKQDLRFKDFSVI